MAISKTVVALEYDQLFVEYTKKRQKNRKKGVIVLLATLNKFALG